MVLSSSADECNISFREICTALNNAQTNPFSARIQTAAEPSVPTYGPMLARLKRAIPS